MFTTKQQEKSNLTLDSLNEIPLISIMEHALIPWGIKDTNSRFVYMNQAAINFCNIPKGFDFEGRLDEELPVAWHELAPELKAHDRKAELSKEGAEVIETSYFGQNEVLEPWYCAKFPIYNSEGKVLGTTFYAKKFNFISVYDFFSNLKPSVITLTPPVSPFTEKELEIIFYALQKLSAKQIAKKLLLSYRTIENRLSVIYSKAKVSGLNQLIEYCQSTGLNSYVPKSVLREKVDFFW
ncbi:helix-turn-helix transcriptional regulator [Arsenophonus sp. PmNCSU2021_1]|uniref:helix-turn-helix transcriptional regulator n=1 Tax=Arsenophonus sp. PmNCSU2021_1 TaxID=3118989 RepID=UPI002FEF454B